MNFSQGWDAGFKAVLIYVGIVFFWLIFVERWFGNQSMSVVIMNVTAIFMAAGYFIYRRRYHRTERAQAEAEIRALLGDDI